MLKQIRTKVQGSIGRRKEGKREKRRVRRERRKEEGGRAREEEERIGRKEGRKSIRIVGNRTSVFANSIKKLFLHRKCRRFCRPKISNKKKVQNVSQT